MVRRLGLALCALLVTVTLGAENITVATVNAWSGLTYRGLFTVGEYEDRSTRGFRLELLVSGLRSLAPQLIAIQEVNPLPAAAERIAARLSYEMVWGVRQAGVRIGPVGLPANLREGSLILAAPGRALELLEVSPLVGPGAGATAAFQLSNASHLLAARTEAAGRPVYVFTTRWTASPHADRSRLAALVDAYDRGTLDGDAFALQVRQAVEGQERRLEEAQKTITLVNRIAGEEPVILFGSLFALPDSPEITALRDAGFVDLWRVVGRGDGTTYDPVTNTTIRTHRLGEAADRARYDYIFVRGSAIAGRSIAVILNRPTFGVHPSTHYGLLAEIRVDPR